MNRDVVIRRLDMLVALIEKSGMITLKDQLGEPEPDVYEKRLGKLDLFNEHLIKITEDIQFIRDLITSKKNIDTDSERVYMISTMRSANRLWKLHHKIITGDFDTIETLEMEERVMEYLDAGSKINAIKYYRDWMNEHTDKGVSLREAKDTIDAYAARKEVYLI